MHWYLILGLAVSIASFLIMDYVVVPRTKEGSFTRLLILVAFVMGGLSLEYAFADPGATFYKTAWLLGFAACVFWGLAITPWWRKRKANAPSLPEADVS